MATEAQSAVVLPSIGELLLNTSHQNHLHSYHQHTHFVPRRRQSVSDILLAQPIVKREEMVSLPEESSHFSDEASYPQTKHHRSLSLVVMGAQGDSLLKDRFQCDQCEASFSRKNSLKRHLFTHTTFRPYGCQTCNRSFYRADIYHRHLKSKRCQQSRS